MVTCTPKSYPTGAAARRPATRSVRSTACASGLARRSIGLNISASMLHCHARTSGANVGVRVRIYAHAMGSRAQRREVSEAQALTSPTKSRATSSVLTRSRIAFSVTVSTCREVVESRAADAALGLPHEVKNGVDELGVLRCRQAPRACGLPSGRCSSLRAGAMLRAARRCMRRDVQASSGGLLVGQGRGCTPLAVWVHASRW